MTRLLFTGLAIFTLLCAFTSANPPIQHTDTLALIGAVAATETSATERP